MEPAAAAPDADHIKIVTALISAGVAVCVVMIKIAWDWLSKRDEKVFKKALTAGNISLEGQVKLYVDAELKSHDARLRIAAEWRLKMLDKMLDAGGDLRVRLNGIFAAINELSREANLNGPSDETRTLVKKCDDVIRKVGTVGGFLPPPLIVEARSLLRRFDDIVHEIVAWSNKKSKPERDAACDATDQTIYVLAEDMTKTFGDWHNAMWRRQEQQLSALASGDERKVEQLFATTTPLFDERPKAPET